MKLIELIEFCQNESGKKVKEETIKKFFQNLPENKSLYLLKCIIDPDIVFNFSTQMIQKAKEICSEVNTYTIIEFLDSLSEKRISGNSAIDIYNVLAKPINDA